MTKGILSVCSIFSPTSLHGFFCTGFTFVRRKRSIKVSCTTATTFFAFLEFFFFCKKFVISFFAYIYHIISFLLADLARGLILPFLYVNIRLGFSYFRLRLRAILTVISIFVLPMLIVIFSPFYRQFLICFPSCYILIIDHTEYKVNEFYGLCHGFLPKFFTATTGVENG